MEDLTTANILHRVDGFDGLTEEEVFGILGEPKKLMILVGTAPNHNEVGLPQYLVLPIDWHQVSNQYILEDSKVIDFGQSFYVAEFQRGCGIPMDYRAPEVILEKNPGLPSDLWALGCVLFEIRTGLKLFPAYDNEDEALTRMVKILGKLPEPWWSTGWVNRKNNFDDGARLDCTSDQITESTTSRSESPKERTPSTVTMQPWNAGDAKSIQQRLRLGLCYDPPGRLPYIRRPISPEEIETFSDLLGQLLQFDPNCRISAGDVLKHSWFTM
jgi:serine/threonine protein kinase